MKIQRIFLIFLFVVIAGNVNLVAATDVGLQPHSTYPPSVLDDYDDYLDPTVDLGFALRSSMVDISSPEMVDEYTTAGFAVADVGQKYSDSQHHSLAALTDFGMKKYLPLAGWLSKWVIWAN